MLKKTELPLPDRSGGFSPEKILFLGGQPKTLKSGNAARSTNVRNAKAAARRWEVKPLATQGRSCRVISNPDRQTLCTAPWALEAGDERTSVRC